MYKVVIQSYNPWQGSRTDCFILFQAAENIDEKVKIKTSI